MATPAAPSLGDFFAKKPAKKKKKGGVVQEASAVAEEPVAKVGADEAEVEGEEESWETQEVEVEVEEQEQEQEQEPELLLLARGPRMDFAASSRDAVEIHGLTPGECEVHQIASFPPVQGAEGICWSPDGQWLGLLGHQFLQVIDASDQEYSLCCELAPLGSDMGESPKGRPGIKSFHFSARGTYAVCYEPPVRSDSQADPDANLAVWRIGSDPVLVGSFIHERRAECSWPALKWTQDERRCCRLARDEIQIFSGDRPDPSAKEDFIVCDGVTSFELSPRPASVDNDDAVGRCKEYIALFVPQRKGERARCLVYSFDDTTTPTAVQELPQTDNVSMRWNPAGTALLLLTSTDVDGTGKSYYGKTGLYLVHMDGTKGVAVVGAKAGPVYDVAWSPREDEFLLLHGDPPCTMTLHDGQQAKKLLDFGKAHRNTIQWSPTGRFFALGGFGQLAGDLDFWDRPSGEKLGQTRYECCVDCQWSADSRHLLGWTTAPRMRVENRFELFDYAGCRLYRAEYDELFSVAWRPTPAESYPDRPPTPNRSRSGSKQAERDNSKAYRAPMSSGTLAARLRAEGEGGERTRAKTAREQEPTKKEFREVPIPGELVGALIGAKGVAIRELGHLAKLPLGVKPPSGEGAEGACVRIGPAGPWDNLDQAQEVVRKRIEELQEQQSLRRNKPGREVPVPEDLVARLIGLKGATIQELIRQAGVPLRVRQAADGNGKVVVIGPLHGEDDVDSLQRAEELIMAKIAELRESDEQRLKTHKEQSWEAKRDEAAGGKGWNEKADRWSSQKGWKNHRGWESDSTWDGDKSWSFDKSWSDDSGWADTNWKDTKDWDRGKDWHQEKGWNEEASTSWKEDGHTWSEAPSRTSERAWPSRGVEDHRGRREPGAQLNGESSTSEGAKKEQPSTSEELDQLRLQGEAALSAGDFHAAVGLFTKAVRLQPRNCSSLCARAQAQLALGDAYEAFMSASMAVRVQPESAVGHLRKGLAQRALGQEEKGLNSLQEALRLDPHNAETKEALGLSSPKASQRAADRPTQEERAFRCAECSDAAEFGAKDEADGQWYCKACWESFVSEDPRLQAPVLPEEDMESTPQACLPPSIPETGPATFDDATPASTPARRRWADEPVQEDGMDEFPSALDRHRPLRAERPEVERHQHRDRGPPGGGKAAKDHSDRRSGGKGGGKKGSGGKDNSEKHRNADKSRGRGGKGGGSASRHGQGQAQAEAPKSTSTAATMSMPRNPFGAARP